MAMQNTAALQSARCACLSPLPRALCKGQINQEQPCHIFACAIMRPRNWPGSAIKVPWFRGSVDVHMAAKHSLLP